MTSPATCICCGVQQSYNGPAQMSIDGLSYYRPFMEPLMVCEPCSARVREAIRALLAGGAHE